VCTRVRRSGLLSHGRLNIEARFRVTGLGNAAEIVFGLQKTKRPEIPTVHCDALKKRTRTKTETRPPRVIVFPRLRFRRVASRSSPALRRSTGNRNRYGGEISGRAFDEMVNSRRTTGRICSPGVGRRKMPIPRAGNCRSVRARDRISGATGDRRVHAVRRGNLALFADLTRRVLGRSGRSIRATRTANSPLEHRARPEMRGDSMPVRSGRGVRRL